MTNDIEALIDEYNNEISEILPISEHINSKINDSIRVLDISPSKIIGFKAEIAHILNVNGGDNILYILDANGMINARKGTDKLMLGPNEKFISNSTISSDKGHFVFRMPADIPKILQIKDKERLIWILDNKNNVLIKDTILSENCIIKGEILDISVFSYRQFGIPTIVRDLLLVDAGNIIVFAIKNNNVIVKSFADIDNLESIGMSKISTSLRASFSKPLEKFINPKDNHLLWILDMDGDIILRNTVLPNNCI